MLTILQNTLARSRGAILGWGLTLAIMGMMFIPFYDSIAENKEQFEQLLEVYPEDLMAFFGESVSFTTPEGYLAIEYFSFMPLVIGVYAVLAGSGLLAVDEERGVLDLLAAQPVSRSALIWGRFLALTVTLFFILVISYSGVMLATTYSAMDLDPVETITPFASLFALLFFFSGLSLLLSMLLPSRQSAAMIAGMALVASFFLNGLVHISDSLAGLEPYVPLTYVQSEQWVEDGFRLDWFAGLVGLGLIFTTLAWQRFLARDIRVAGEGGWRLPRLRRVR
jgi:ABC-2 type transport system permease protein